MLPILVHVHLSALFLARRVVERATRSRRDESGQTSAEYALVLLGAGLVAALVLAWARSTGKVGDLLDEMVDKVLDAA